MDKNSITGLLIIGAILIGWMYITKPTQEEIAYQQFQQDSIAEIQAILNTPKEETVTSSTNNTPTPTINILSDSVKSAMQLMAYGDFLDASKGKEKVILMENDLMKVLISSVGGRIQSVELKKYNQ